MYGKLFINKLCVLYLQRNFILRSSVQVEWFKKYLKNLTPDIIFANMCDSKITNYDL